MQARQTKQLVEEAFMKCHTVEHIKELAARPISLSDELRQADRRELDDAVLEMIGVNDEKKRTYILDELCLETAKHYRQVRIVEVQKQVQRAGSNHRLTADDLARSIWDSLSDDEKGPPLADWLASLKADRQTVHIPDGKAKALGKGHMFAPSGVDFTQGKTVHHETYANPAQAALAAELANLEIRGNVEVPADEPTCRQWIKDIQSRLAEGHGRFDALAGSRTGTEALRAATAGLLMQWFIHGRQ